MTGRPNKMSLQSSVRNQKCYRCQWQGKLTKCPCNVQLENKRVTYVNEKKSLPNMPTKVLQENKHIRGVIDKIPTAKFWRNKRYDKCHNDKQTLKIPIAKFCWQPNCDRDYKITTSKICKKKPTGMWLIVLGFNYTSTLEGHFVSSPREREKR